MAYRLREGLRPDRFFEMPGHTHHHLLCGLCIIPEQGLEHLVGHAQRTTRRPEIGKARELRANARCQDGCTSRVGECGHEESETPCCCAEAHGRQEHIE